MSDKGYRGSKSTAAKDWAAVIGATALLGAGGAGLGYMAPDVPDAPETIQTQTQQPTTFISDPSDVLTEDDERRLLRDSGRLARPSTVHTIHYIALTENRDNVNDSVENFLRDNFPEEIGDQYFADGVLIVGADVEGRNNFIFAGQDVLDQLHLHSGQRLEAALEAMKPGLRDNNIPAGFFAGANTALNLEDAQQYPITRAKNDQAAYAIGGGAAAGGLALGGGAIAASQRSKRRRQIEQAWADHQTIATKYTGLSQRLDELDIRANSLTSGFADQELRKQWAEVRDEFLGMHDAMRYEVGTDRQAYENRKDLAKAAQTVTDTGHAEDNINRLFRMEQGDAATRRSMLTDIRGDVQEARRKVKSREIKRELEVLEQRIEVLDANPSSPTFIDDFVRVLDDYRRLLDEVKRREFSDVKEHNKLAQPRLTDPGFIYVNYVPYTTMHTWHSSNVEAERAAQSSSSSGTNTSFSSGFSGGGGSSSY